MEWGRSCARLPSPWVPARPCHSPVPVGKVNSDAMDTLSGAHRHPVLPSPVLPERLNGRLVLDQAQKIRVGLTHAKAPQARFRTGTPPAPWSPSSRLAGNLGAGAQSKRGIGDQSPPPN
jgi:hypothetical protein